MCERHKNSPRTRFYLTPTVCKHVCRLFLCRSQTPTWVCQNEFANLSLQCEGGFKSEEIQLVSNEETVAKLATSSFVFGWTVRKIVFLKLIYFLWLTFKVRFGLSVEKGKLCACLCSFFVALVKLASLLSTLVNWLVYRYCCRRSEIIKLIILLASAQRDVACENSRQIFAPCSRETPLSGPGAKKDTAVSQAKRSEMIWK